MEVGIEGRLSIGLRTDSRRVNQVIIDSSRPVHASRVFHGKGVSEALKALPMLFAVCGTAQACAGVRACEQALGVRPAQPIERVRDCLVCMETVREHLWRILLDWPAFLGETPANSGMREMLALQRDNRLALTGGYDPFLPSAADHLPEPAIARDLARKVAVLLGQLVFGMPPTRWLNINRPEMLEQWSASGASVAARLLDHIRRVGWSRVGGCEVEALPLMETDQLHQVIQDDHFIERPQWFGDCCETTCLTRVDSPLLQRLRTRHGNGLLVRLVARLTELAQLSGYLLPEMMPIDDAVPVSAQNPGVGRSDAARGQLLHRVRLDGERIVSYQILAPTEWNFHPQGVVSRSLATLYGDGAQIEQQARLLINAIDPCVAYDLSIA